MSVRFCLKGTLFVLSLMYCWPCVSANAQAQKAANEDASAYVRVSAPLAQSILIKVKARHDDIVKLGLHAVPPGSTDNVIIANIAPEKIGKKSSAKDLEKLAENKQIAVALDASRTFDLLIPIAAANGGDLNGGFIVMEVPYSKASNQDDALKIGLEIHDEIQRLIPGKAALYQ